jgi:hypothetical protein
MGLPSLDGFIRDLEEHDLVSHGVNGPSPWQQRTAWRPAERTLFVLALRNARQGNTGDARRALEQLLGTAPGNHEARALKASLDERNTRAFQDAFLASERAWLHDTAPSRAELQAVRPSFGPLIVLAGLALSLLVGFFVPFPRTVNAPATLAPIATVEVTAPHEGTVQSVAVSEGQRVQGGDVLYTDARGPVHAPISGVVANLLVANGQPTVLGQRAVVIEDHSRLQLTVRLTGTGSSAVQVGQTATLTSGDHRLKTRLDALGNGEAKAIIDNRSGDVEPGVATVDIDVPAASLFQRLR